MAYLTYQTLPSKDGYITYMFSSMCMLSGAQKQIGRSDLRMVKASAITVRSQCFRSDWPCRVLMLYKNASQLVFDDCAAPFPSYIITILPHPAYIIETTPDIKKLIPNFV